MKNNKFNPIEHTKQVIRWILFIFLIGSLLLSTTVISIIAHEYIHIANLKTEHITPEQVCFLGSYTIPFIPFQTGIGWVESIQMRDLLPKERERSENEASIIEAIVWFICFTIDMILVWLFYNHLIKQPIVNERRLSQ